jgi:hypothetical protein
MRLDWFVREYNKSTYAEEYGRATKAVVEAVLNEQDCDIGQYDDSDFDYIAVLYGSRRDFVSVPRAITKKKEPLARLEGLSDTLFPFTPMLFRYRKCEVIEVKKPPYSIQPESSRELRGRGKPHFWIFKHSGEPVPYKANPDILEQAINLPLTDNPFLDEPPSEVFEFLEEWGPLGIYNIFAYRFKDISREIRKVRRGKSDLDIPADWPSLWDIHIWGSAYDFDEMIRVVNEAGLSTDDFIGRVRRIEANPDHPGPALVSLSQMIGEELGWLFQESWSLTHYYLVELQKCYKAWRSAEVLFSEINSRLDGIKIEIIGEGGGTAYDLKACSLIETLYGLLAKDMIEDIDWRTCENKLRPEHDFRRIKDNRQIYCGTQCRQQMADANRGKTGKKAAAKKRGSAK